MARGRKRIAFAGATQTGKSTNVRKLIDHGNEPVIVHDLNGQAIYRDLPEITMNEFARQKSGKYRIADPDYEKFFDIAFKHFRNGKIISEDASNYLGPQKNMKIFPNLIGLRHPEHNVDIVFVTHSLTDLPQYIIRQLNDIVIHKTGDSWTKDLEARFPEFKQQEVKETFFRVNQDPDQFYFESVILQKTGEHHFKIAAHGK